ncbi:MAG: sensor histidine kinase [Candidatus Tectimicrobiota bacterium]
MDTEQQTTPPGKHPPLPAAVLGRLAGLVSHDICNPFNAIFLHTDLLEEDLQQLPPQVREPMLASLAEVKTEVGRLQALIQDYLILGRLGELTYQPEMLEHIVASCRMEMHTLCETRELSIHLEGLADLPQVALHRSSITQALSNILRQALSTTPPGGTVTIRGRQDSGYACLEIKDSGPGMSPEDVAGLFEPWNATHVDGSTLAMYVAQAISIAHGGRLTVQSAPGQGTVFTLHLPCIEAA